MDSYVTLRHLEGNTGELELGGHRSVDLPRLMADSDPTEHLARDTGNGALPGVSTASYRYLRRMLEAPRA